MALSFADGESSLALHPHEKHKHMTLTAIRVPMTHSNPIGEVRNKLAENGGLFEGERLRTTDAILAPSQGRRVVCRVNPDRCGDERPRSWSYAR
jgi:hypothetical protein